MKRVIKTSIQNNDDSQYNYALKQCLAQLRKNVNKFADFYRNGFDINSAARKVGYSQDETTSYRFYSNLYYYTYTFRGYIDAGDLIIGDSPKIIYWIESTGLNTSLVTKQYTKFMR